jgi:hypothetical protein
MTGISVINTPSSSTFLKREPSKGPTKLKTSSFESRTREAEPSILSKASKVSGDP